MAYLVPSVVLLLVCGKIKHLHACVRVHDYILRHGLLSKLLDALICMYARCGGLAKAQQLFAAGKKKDVSTWTSLISKYVQIGQGHDALRLFEQMQNECLSPSTLTFVYALKACSIIKSPEKGSEIHNQIVTAGLFNCCIQLANTTIGMYAKCGVFTKAQRILEELHARNTVSWNALISGYVEHGKNNEAFECFEQMQLEGNYPDAVTFICLLKACACTRATDMGLKLHDEISKRGLLENNVVLGCTLVYMYAKCGAFTNAEQALAELPTQTVVAWNALISGLADHGANEQSWKCFKDMKRGDLCPDVVTFASILKACKSMPEIRKGEEIHQQLSKQGLPGHDIVLGNSLVGMYASCGALVRAYEVFEELHTRNATSWNTLICGYVEHNQGGQALSCFERMKHEGIRPNAISFTCALKACGSIGAIHTGRELHEDAWKQGLIENNAFFGTALLDMYGRCGALEKAADLLEELPLRDCISWSALIARYVECGKYSCALDSFRQMLSEGFHPNAVTFASLLKACGNIGAIGTGERIHENIVKCGLLHDDTMLCNALIDMYAKCGMLTKAQQVLHELTAKDVISWTALMAGQAKHCHFLETLKCFEGLLQEGIFPDAHLFSCILSVYSRLGLVEDSVKWFESMCTSYDIIPDIKHYTCIIHGFGQVGCLDRAARIIDKLWSSDSGAWSALMSACNKCGEHDIAGWAFIHCAGDCI